MMPLYEYVCQPCDIAEDRFSDVESRNLQRCTICGTTLTRLISKQTVVGPTSTKPVTLAGKTFETASAVRQWEAANPGLVTTSKNDSSIRDKRYSYRHQIEKKAQSLGYRSEKHRQAECLKQGQPQPK